MTTIYFVRHAESDYSVRESRIRPLTEKGLADRPLVTDYLRDKNIDVVLSSPYKRAVDTLADFAEKYSFEIETVESFRELSSNGKLVEEGDFASVMERLWADFNTKLNGCECLAEVQERNVSALKELLVRYRGKNIVIGTHGLALSSIINYYDKSYGYVDFMNMAEKTPWVVKMTFDGFVVVGIEMVDL